MKRLNMLAVLLLAGAAAAAPKAAPKADLAKGKEVAKSVCASCHAEDGNSSIAMYPKVAGQHASYVLTQTLDIKNKKRTSGSSGMMAPMVQNLSESDIRNVAAYYAKQQAKPGEANPKENIELGRNIYRAGLPEKKVPACMSCHGPAAPASRRRHRHHRLPAPGRSAFGLYRRTAQSLCRRPAHQTPTA